MIRHMNHWLQLVFLGWGTLVACAAFAQQVPHTFIYEPSTGNFSLDNDGPLLSTLEIKSASGVFTGTKPSQLNGLFDVFTPNKFFRLLPTGFDDIDWGPVITPGLSVDFLTADLTFNGSRLPKEPLGATRIVAKESTPWILEYDPASGTIGLQRSTPTPANNALTSIVIDSATGFFSGQRPADLTNDFDIFRPNRAFKLQPAGFASLVWPGAGATGRTEQQLADDLCIAGSFVGGGMLLGVHVNRADGPLLHTCPTLPDLGGPIDQEDGHGIILSYYPDGRVVLFTNGQKVSTLEIKSPDGIFTGVHPPQLNGLFDVFNPSKLFWLNPTGFGDTDFGIIATPGLTPDVVSNLEIGGSILPKGALGNVRVAYVALPEPTSCLLVTAGVLPLFHSLRRRQDVVTSFTSLR